MSGVLEHFCILSHLCMTHGEFVVDPNHHSEFTKVIQMAQHMIMSCPFVDPDQSETSYAKNIKTMQ